MIAPEDMSIGVLGKIDSPPLILVPLLLPRSITVILVSATISWACRREIPVTLNGMWHELLAPMMYAPFSRVALAGGVSGVEMVISTINHKPLRSLRRLL